MAASFIRLYEENPDPRKITQIVNVLRGGGLIIYPSDTIYGLGCDIFNQKAVDCFFLDTIETLLPTI